MRIIDRLLAYLRSKGITAYSFERDCRIANGYLRKQERGKGSVGSEILERVHRQYPDLDLRWLLSGTGTMLAGGVGAHSPGEHLSGPEGSQIALAERVALLESAIADKDKIIALLEERLRRAAPPASHADVDPALIQPEADRPHQGHHT